LNFLGKQRKRTVRGDLEEQERALHVTHTRQNKHGGSLSPQG
jgi:hypothetical protein